MRYELNHRGTLVDRLTAALEGLPWTTYGMYEAAPPLGAPAGSGWQRRAAEALADVTLDASTTAGTPAR